MFNLDKAGDSLANRVTSAFPISISTALALESLFQPRIQPYDPDRKIPNTVDISKYTDMYFNIYTLFRNLSQSVSKEVFIKANPEQLAVVLLEDIEIIDSLFKNEGYNLCRPIYYFMSYEDLYKLKVSKQVKLRRESTDSQTMFKHKFMQTIKYLEKNLHYVKYNDEVKPNQKNTSLILTHVAYDLLSHRNFSKLDLLESNTGKLKPKYLWNTKYYPVGDGHLNNLPFNRKLLFIFGDKTLIHPTPIKLRRLILEISEKRHWNPNTSLDKIIMDIGLDIKDPYLLQFYKDL